MNLCGERTIESDELRCAEMERVLLIGLAGAFGAVSRYAVQMWVLRLIGGPTMLGTAIVNISGTFVLGLIFALTEDRFLSEGPWRAMITVGFLGAYTTFSTFMLESFARIEAGDLLPALLNLGGSVLLGLLAVYAGLTLGRALV